MAKAQGRIENAKKDSKNPFFKSSYADLASCTEACKHALSENNIAVVQLPSTSENGKIAVETMLVHATGEWISEKLELMPVKQDPQSAGSAITYARRYALCAMVGIAPEDDDGNQASGNHLNGNGHHELPKKQVVQPESESQSPTTRNAKAKAADPLANKYLNGKWKDVVCHFGKKDGPILGKKLGSIDRQKLAWLRDEWKPKANDKGFYDGKDLDLEEAIKAYAVERQIEKEREEVVQEHPAEPEDVIWDAEPVREAR